MGQNQPTSQVGLLLLLLHDCLLAAFILPACMRPQQTSSTCAGVVTPSPRAGTQGQQESHAGHMADTEVVHPKSPAMPPEDVVLFPAG